MSLETHQHDRYAWASSAPEAVAPGVLRIPLPLPGDALRAVNVYAISDGDGLVLIDAGADAPASQAALRAGLATLGATVRDIRTVIATHVHFDHYGQASDLRRLSGCRVWLCDEDEPSLRTAIDEEVWTASRVDRRRWLRGYGAEAVVDRFEEQSREWELEAVDTPGRWAAPDRALRPGETLGLRTRELEVILTPGHTRGHVCLLDRQAGVLFAGDHVLPHITPSIGFEPFADGQALRRFLGSLRLVRDLPVTHVLPGHGPVFGDLARRVDELLDHHAQRLDRSVERVRELGVARAAEVAAGLRWTRHGRRFDELDAFNQFLAVSETIAHLEHLVIEQRLAASPGELRTFKIEDTQ